MERSVFEIVKAPLGWSVFADNVKIGGVYDSRRRSKPPHWPRPTISDGWRSDQRARRGRKAEMGVAFESRPSCHASGREQRTVKPV